LIDIKCIILSGTFFLLRVHFPITTATTDHVATCSANERRNRGHLASFALCSDTISGNDRQCRELVSALCQPLVTQRSRKHVREQCRAWWRNVSWIGDDAYNAMS